MTRCSGSGEEKILKQNLRFVISLGGFDFEPFEGTSISWSAQQRIVNLGVTETILFWIVQKNFIFKLHKVEKKVFSAQAEQDLILRVVMGNSAISTSGKIMPSSTAPSAPPTLVTEARIPATPGMPLDSISNATGLGIPDNYSPDERLFGIGFENDRITCQVTNQSDVINHPIRLKLYGWTFPMGGRTKEEILRFLQK